jgi:hypothetical protein
MRRAAILFGLLLVGCNRPARSQTRVVPAAHPPAPLVVKGSGAVLASPVLVPIVYEGDPLASALVEFVDWIGGSAYWAPLSQYGVGPARARGAIVERERPPKLFRDGAIARFVAERLSGDDPAWGAPDPQAIYTLFLPPGITITRGDLRSCRFDGYHGSVRVGEIAVAFAVVPRCGPSDDRRALDALTGVASHELIEAATDPFPDVGARGYAYVDRDHLVYALRPGGEIVDLCEDDAFVVPDGARFMVQRWWSNEAARAARDPCVPGGRRFFGAVPVVHEDLPIAAPYFAGGIDGTTKGIRVPLGTERTIEIVVFSDRAQPLEISAYDESGALEFTLDRTTARNGDRIRATVRRQSTGAIGGTPFVIEARSTRTRRRARAYAGN